MPVPANTITDISSRNGLLLDETAGRLLQQYQELLLEWNRRINLVSRRDAGSSLENHILHSLSLLWNVEIRCGARVLDLGTGGGLPGIPLAIARPDLEVVLLDSIRKKIRAVDDIVARLGLGNVSTRCARAEELPEQNSFDLIVSRGVAELTELVRWSRLLARKTMPSGTPGAAASPRHLPEPCLLCLKGGDLEGEIARAATKTGVRNISVLDCIFRYGRDPDFEGKKIVVVPL